MTRPLNIIVVENSQMLYEGLVQIAIQSGLSFKSSHAGNLEEAERLICAKPSSIVILNPAIIQHSIKVFNTLKTKWEKVKWLALVYVYYDEATLSLFDGIIYISDSPKVLASSVKKILASETNRSTVSSGNFLSERETEVLRQLAFGLSNKEIADKLNISVNTVISHRKNISQKTGIKTVSGLTVFAVVNKLIPLDQDLMF